MAKDTQFLKFLLERTEEIGQLERRYPWFALSSARINIGHALDDVRTNGHQQRASLLDVMKDFERLEERLMDTQKRIKRSLHLIRACQATYTLTREVCPECKGEKGEKFQPYGFNWHDCPRCSGWGYVTKEVNARG